MHLGHALAQHPPSGRFDAIVIGSGLGGLVAAALLSRHGKQRVLVLERHYRLGGYTHTFTRPGYEWDVGVHYVGQVGEKGALKGAFDRLTDGRLRWAPLPEVYDSIELGERRYGLPAGRARFIEALSDRFPREGDAIRAYVDLVRATARQSSTFFLARALPGLVTRLVQPVVSRGFKQIAGRTTREVLEELTRDEELLAVLTGQYGDYGLPPRQASFAIHAAVVAHYLGGGFYPVGGASSFAAGLAPLIEERGGHLAVSAEVASVVVEHGRAVGVRLAEGRELRAPLVISDAGVATTFGRLVPEDARPRAWVDALRTVTPSSGAFSVYLGFRHTDAELGLTGTNLWLYPDEKHDENVERFYRDPSAPLPMVYCSFPSAKDPDWSRRFPGRAAVDLITMARWEWFEPWAASRWRKRAPGYEALKADFTARLLQALYRRLPQLEGQVDVVEASTPLSTQHFTGHPRGELYGLDHSPQRYRLPLHARTPLPGLFLTGADVATCGVAGAALGGVLAASAILGPRLVPQVLQRG
jgi:all-trans-retinol 13,14-reductase